MYGRIAAFAAFFSASSMLTATFMGCVGDEVTPSPAGADSGTSSSGGSSSGASSSGGSSSGGSSSGGSSSGGSSSGGSSSGGTGDGGPDAGWTPKQLTGLSLWFDNASGPAFDGTSKLTSWADQSGNGNNATIGAPCLAPARAAASLNGKDTLVFDGDPDGGTCVSVADHATLQFGGGDFAIFVVARYANPPGILGEKPNGTFWSKSIQASPYTGIWFNGNTLSESKIQARQQNLTGNQVIGATAGQNDNTFRRFGLTRRGTDFEVWVNGVSDGKTVLPNQDDVSTPGRNVFIGGTPEITKGWLSGNIAEVVAVKNFVANVEIAQLDAYFKAKHALP
jgi:hypothetical protein